MKLHLRVSRVLLCASYEAVLVDLRLPGGHTAVCLWVGCIQASFPIICQLLCAAPQIKSISLLSFCHLINIYLSRPVYSLFTLLSLTTNLESLANTLKFSMKTLANL